MDTVTAEFEQGSKYDALLLFTGVALIITGFLTLNDYDFWESRDDLWVPISGLGFGLIILNVALRFVRPKLKLDILSKYDDTLLIQLPSNIQFSAWVNDHIKETKISDIKSIDVSDNRRTTHHGPVGMLTVGFDLSSRQYIEGNIDDPLIVKDIILFAKHHLPGVPLHMDELVKSNKSLNTDVPR
jgi:hypothetical protein